MSVLYIGAYAWSVSVAASSSSSSSCEATTASGVSVQVSDSACWNCSALTTSGDRSSDTNSYGGSISACYIGAFSYSSALGDGRVSSRSVVGATRVHNLLITFRNATMADTEAVSGEYYSIQPILFSQTDVILCISIKRGFIGRQREFFCPESPLLQSVVTTVFTLCRFTVAQSVQWWGLIRHLLLEPVHPLHYVATRCATVAVFSFLVLQSGIAAFCRIRQVTRTSLSCSVLVGAYI